MVNPLLLVAGTASLLGSGYVFGRVRPLWRTRVWARRELFSSRRRSAPFIVLLLVLLPDDAWWMWKHRNDPPRHRAPAPILNPKWGNKVHQEERP